MGSTMAGSTDTSVPSKQEVRARLAAVRRLVGRTPVVAVRCRFRGREVRINQR